VLHGYLSTSKKYDPPRILVLATRYCIIAPDYPVFGLSDAPEPDK
jgi:pimeloyl-ACP methyl ester carboxylesterase